MMAGANGGAFNFAQAPGQTGGFTVTNALDGSVALPVGTAIRLAFNGETTSGLHWGMRWTGDHAAALRALYTNAAPQLVLSGLPPELTFDPFSDIWYSDPLQGGDGYSYVSYVGGSVAPDADGDGMPDAWEIAHFGATNAVDGGAEEDFDRDRFLNIEEYWADTLPDNSNSLLRLTMARSAAGAGRVEWQSVTTRMYSVYRTAGLTAGWPVEPATSGIAGDPSGTNGFDDVGAPPPPVYYRVTTSLPPGP
jgi:hypothetical protein